MVRGEPDQQDSNPDPPMHSQPHPGPPVPQDLTSPGPLAPPSPLTAAPAASGPLPPPQPTLASPGQDLASLIKTGLLLLSIYAYFAGWLYVFYFFDHFGLSIGSVDIPAFYFFVYSCFLLPQQLNWQVGLSVVAVLVVVSLLVAWYLVGWFRPLFFGVVVSILIVAVPLGIFTLAQQEGIYQAKRLRAGYTTHKVRFVFRQDAAIRYSPSFLKLSSSYGLTVITETKDRYYVFHAQGRGEPNQLPYGTTYSIAKSDILLADVELQNVSPPDQEPSD